MAAIRAVLTGDLIKSRQLSAARFEQARDLLLESAADLNQWSRGLLQGRPEFFRGDAWQLLLADPRWALRAAVFLRTSLRASEIVDTRVVIGLGTVDQVNAQRVSLSTGQAFTLSGQALDGLTQYFRMSIALPAEAGWVAAWMPVVAQLCDMLIGHWTARQAQIVRVALGPHEPTHAAIAERLAPPVSKQAVSKALAGADWHGLRAALKEFENTPWQELVG